MRKYRNFCIFIILCSLTVFLLLKNDYRQFGLTGLASGSNIFSEEKIRVLSRIYDSNYVTNSDIGKQIATYLPSYQENGIQTAEYYKKMFGIDSDINDGEESYSFRDENGMWKIEKFISHISYQADEDAEFGDLPEDAAVDIAERFFSERGLPLYYSGISVLREENCFVISFISTLAGIKNYAFPNVVSVSGAGKVQWAEYYSFAYDKISTNKIISMRRAYYELPVDFGTNIRIDLKRCSLVYYYADSIVQPAYLFEGETNNGEAFAYFVRASEYR